MTAFDPENPHRSIRTHDADAEERLREITKAQETINQNLVEIYSVALQRVVDAVFFGWTITGLAALHLIILALILWRVW